MYVCIYITQNGLRVTAISFQLFRNYTFSSCVSMNNNKLFNYSVAAAFFWCCCCYCHKNRRTILFNSKYQQMS